MSVVAPVTDLPIALPPGRRDAYPADEAGGSGVGHREDTGDADAGARVGRLDDQAVADVHRDVADR